MKVFLAYLWLFSSLLMASSGWAQTSCSSYPTPQIQPSVEAFCQQPIAGDNDRKCMEICENASITYSTPPTGNTITWEAFGDVTPSTGSGPDFTVNWNSPGSGLIQVTETDGAGCSTTRQQCIEILAAPSADFAIQPPAVANVVSVCSGADVYFQDQSSPDAIAWLWDFGDGSQSSDPNPSHAYVNAGTYQVLLTVYNDCGCIGSKEITVEVETGIAPVLDCNSTICSNEEATYTVSNACPGATYNWSIEGGTIQGTENNQVTVLWGSPATGTGLLTVQISGCNDICSLPTTIQVPILSNNIQLDGPLEVCVGDLVEYSLPPQPGATYQWGGSAASNFVSTPNDHSIDVNWASTGSFEICVNVSLGSISCNSYPSICKTVQVKDAFEVSPPFQEVCYSDNFSFFTLPAASASWKAIGVMGGVTSLANNETSISTSGLAPGFYEIQATVSSSNQSYCNQEATAYLQVLAPAPSIPTSDLSGDLQICPGSSYDYTVSPAAGHYVEWAATGGTISGAGNTVSVSWGNTPPYELQITQNPIVGPACPSTSTFGLPAIVPTAPVITGSQTVCTDGQGSYTASAVPGASNTSWEILQGVMASIVNGQNANVVDLQFNNVAGQFTLRYHYSICNVDYFQDYFINISAQPAIILNVPNNACQNDAVATVMTAQLSPQPSGATINWAWDFGTAGTATDVGTSSSVQFSFPNSGTELVSVTASIAGGTCTSTVTATDLIDVRPSPLVNITASEGDVICPPDVTSTILTASVQNAPGGNGNYTYTWSGGQSGATYTVSSAGSYTLTVTDNANGCETVSTFTVTTCASSPQSCTGVDFSSSQSDCRTFDFTAILSSPWTNPSWDFGDGQFATGYNVSHQYTNSGYYQVTLTGFNGPTFCRETKQVVVHFVPNFIAEFSCTNSMGGNSMDVQLIDQTDFLPGTTLSYSWTYPGGTSTSQNPLVSGMSSGMVTLTVSDGSTTCSTPATYVDVPEPITAIIDAVAPACEGHPIAFSNISTPSVANIVSASWDFGDGSGSNQIAQAERTYTYPLTGPIVGLTVTDIYGCISSTTQAITVYQNGLLGNVSVSAPSNPACPSPPLQLTANYPVNTPTPSFQWYSSDQSVNLGTTNPSAAVPATGEYYVEITDANGCVARSDNETVVITPAPDASISGLAQLCQGENIQWRVNPGSNLSYNWEVITPSGTQSFNGSTVNLTGNQLGTYTAQVTVTDATTSCQEISPVFTTQVTGAPQSLAIANAGPNCAPANLSASVSSPSSVDFVWSTGDVGPTTSAPVSGTVEVTAYTDQGCSATSSIDIGEGPDLADVAVGCYCFRDPVNWSAPQGAGYTYAWYQASSPSDVLLGTNDQQNLLASGVYYVVVTDANGCSSTSGYINMDIGGDCNCRFEVRPLTLDCVGRDDKTGGYIYSFSTVLINSGVALNGLYAVSNEGTVSGLSPVSFPGGGVTTPLSGTFTLLPGQNDAAITFSAVGSNGENCSVTIIVKSFPDCTQDACRVDWSKPNVNCRFVYQGFAYFDFFITATNNGNPVTNLAWYPYTNNSGASLTTSTNFLAGNSITSITGMVRVPQGTTSESFKACGYDAITGQKCCWKITVAFPKCNEVQEPCTEVINKGQKIVCSKPSKDPAGNSLYDFSLKLCAPLSNGLAQLIPQTGQSENLVTNLSVTVSNNNYSLMGTIVDVPNFNEPLCFWAIISSAGEYCWTEICFDIPDCDAPVEKGGASVEHVAQKPWELSRLQVRPNPASTYFQVDYLPLDESAIEWRLMSVDGRLLRSWSDVAADGDIRLETDGLASGLYFLGMYQRGVMVAQERVVILQEP